MGRQIDPRDPNGWLWLLLTSNTPRGTTTPSIEQRLAVSKKMKMRYFETPHYLQDEDVEHTVNPNHNRPPRAICRMCGYPLNHPEAVKRGISDKCLRNGIARGDIVLKPDGTYQIKKYSKRKKK